MRQVRAALITTLIAVLMACTADEVRPAGAPQDIDPNATVEDLYFEAIELYSDGLLPQVRMDALREGLATADARRDESARKQQSRDVITAILRRTYNELRQSSDEPVLAGREGRAYARRLNRAGIHEAERYAEQAVLIADMLGVPTSKTDAVLMVAIPAGGAIVLKLGTFGIKRAAFLLRNLRSADEVIEQSSRLGFKAAYAADREEMRRLVGDAATEALEHIGSAEGPTSGKLNPWNPSGRADNCTACVASVIRNSLEGMFKYSADDMERLFEFAGRQREFSVQDSLSYIERHTGLAATSKPVSMLGERAPIGHYAIMTSWDGTHYTHVVYGRVTPTGKVIVFDPQLNKRMTYAEMLERGGRAAPYLLEAR
jgi:hypothetical protein